MTTTLEEREEAIATLLAGLTLDHPESAVTSWSYGSTTGVRDVGIINTGSTQTFLVNPDWMRRVERGDFSD